jgi:hypothetical protein
VPSVAVVVPAGGKIARLACGPAGTGNATRGVV